MDADSKGSGKSAHLQGLPETSFLDTAMSTSTKSNKLAHLIYSLLLVIIHFGLVWNIQIINRMQLHNNDDVSMGMLSTKFNIKQFTLLNKVLLPEIIQIKNPNVEVLSFKHVYNTILKCKGPFLRINFISFKYITRLNILNKCCLR